MSQDPAGEGREIVGGKCHKRVLAIEIRRDEATVMRALKQHHLIRPEAPAGGGLAKILRDRPEILADDDALVRNALLARDGHERLERKPYVSTLVGSHAIRNEIEPLQSQDVVEPNGRRIAHR